MQMLSQQQRRELMDRYAPMVFNALFHTGYSVRREIAWRDLLKVGRMGLHLAVADYDAGREAQFRRRARQCVRRAVSDWLAYLEIKPGPRPAPRRRCSQFVDSYAGVSFPDIRRALRK